MLISLYLIFECAFNLWCKIFFSIASAVRSLTVFSAIWQPSGKEVSGRIHSSPLYTFKNWMCSPCIHAVAQFKVLLSIQKKRETAALRQFLSFMLQRGLGLRAPASCRHPPTRLDPLPRPSMGADPRSRSAGISFQVLPGYKKTEINPAGQFRFFMLQRGLGLRAPASCRHPPTRLRSYIRIHADVRSRYSRRRSVSSPPRLQKK